MPFKKSIIAGFAIAAVLSSGSAVFAKADLVFVHNASPYHVWSDLVQCQHDLRNANNGCDSFYMGKNKSCGMHLFATSATGHVAKDRLGRRQNVKLFANNGSNSVVCNIKP